MNIRVKKEIITKNGNNILKTNISQYFQHINKDPEKEMERQAGLKVCRFEKNKLFFKKTG